MLIALAVLAALETASPSAPPAVELKMSGADGAPVSAAPRTLSDVARERREGRRAVGGFSAAETTIAREPIVLPAFLWEDEPLRRDREVAPQPQPGGEVPYVSGWGGWSGGGVAGTPRRPPHVSRHARPSHRPKSSPGAAPSRPAGGPNVTRSSARAGIPAGGSFPRP